MKITSIYKYLILLFVLQGTLVFAQSPLIVNMQVLPPYSPVIADYLTFDATSVITITNTSNSSYDVKLAVHIEGDNGIEAFTNPGFLPSQAITVAPFATRTIYGSELQSYNDVGYTVIGADAQNIIVSGVVPDGFYTICIQALDYLTDAPLSSPEPSGCIPIYIQYLDAPFLISPICGDSITQTFPQTIIFNWITPPGAPLTTQYRFKLIEVIPNNRNPYDAMAASTTPVFYETTTNMPLLVYGPGQPPLEVGQTYAWQVTAFNPTVATYFQNEGKSEVCAFNYKDGFVNYINNTDFINISLNADTVRINGNLQYYYASSPDDEGTHTVINTTASAVNYPLGSEPVRLITKYMLKYNGGADSIYLPYNATGFTATDIDKVLNTTTTSANGDFSFYVLTNNFPETGLVQTGVTVTIPDVNLINHYFNESTGGAGGFDFDLGDFGGFTDGFGTVPENGYTFENLNDKNYIAGNGFNYKTTTPEPGKLDAGEVVNAVNYAGGGTASPYSGTFTGDLYRVLQVYVSNPYYCMPDNSFRNISDSTSTYVGQITARVRDYGLTVDLNNLYNENGTTNYINNAGGTIANNNKTVEPNNNKGGLTIAEPDNGKTLNLGGGFNAGNFVAQPEYYYFADEDNDNNFTAQLPNDFEFTGTNNYTIAGGIYRYSIYRELDIDNLPKHEGQDLGNDGELLLIEGGTPGDFVLYDINGPKDYGAGRTLIARVESANGQASFSKLIKSLSPDDYYILVIEPMDDVDINPAVEIKFRYDYNNFNQVDKAIYNSQFTTRIVDLNETENTTLTSTAVVTGKINYKFDDPQIGESFPLKNVNVTLQRVQYVITEDGAKKYSRIRTDLATVKTDAQGVYLFNYTDTAAYGLIAMDAVIFGEDNCTLDIPDEVNPDLPGIDVINPGNINMQINNQLHFKTTVDDIFEFTLPAKYGKSTPKRIALIAAPQPDGVTSPCPYSGRLYQELAIKVESEYYTSPATHFTIEPAQYKEVPDLLCYVKSYDLTLTVKADPDIAVQYKTPNSTLRDMMVVLMRKNKPADVPENEGIAGGIDNAAIAKFITNSSKLYDFTGSGIQVNIDNDFGGGLYEMEMYDPYLEAGYLNTTTINESEIIGCGVVDVNGKITFKNLVKNIGPSDEYTLLAIPDYENSDINYLIPEHDFKTNFIVYNSVHPYGPIIIPTTESTAKEGFYPKMNVNYTMEAIPQNPIIFGKVLRSDNGFPLMDADVTLLDNPGSIVEMQTKTAGDGTYFLTLTKEQYNANSVALFTRQLKFSKYGYDDTYSAFPLYLKKGKILNRVADTIQPAVLVTGYIYTENWDEDESIYGAAPAYVQIGNGPQVHTACEDNDFVLDLSVFTDYVEQQHELDITVMVPNYEEMWEQNLWDPSVQVFQNHYDFQGNVFGNLNVNDINMGGGAVNRSLNLGDGETGIVINDFNKGGAPEGTVNGKVAGVETNKGDIGGTGLVGGIKGDATYDNNCALAFYTTYASRGTWLAEINPDSSKYITRFENVYIPDTGNVLRVDFMVYQKLHRMHFVVKDVNGNPINAYIEVVGITDNLNTGADGIRDINFENGGNTFTVLINGGATSGFIQKEMTITNNASEFATTYIVELIKGATISGKVTSGVPAVANARVFIDAAGLEYLETYTDANGNYTLYGVPKINGFTMRAVKEGTGLIGDSHWVVTLGATNITNMNFNLTAYTELDLSKLLGFTTEIEYLSNYGGEIKISGALVAINSNSRFGFAAGTRLPFNYVKIKASNVLNGSGVPYAEPIDSSFTIVNSDAIPLTVYNNYDALIGVTASTCKVEKVNATSGKIKSPVKVLETSFTNPAFNLNGLGVTGFYLENKTIGMAGGFGAVGDISHDDIVIFTSGAATLPNYDYYQIEVPSVADKLLLNVQNVAAYIKGSSNNRVYKDSLVLDTWLDPYIAYTEGFTAPLNIGKIQVTPTTISSKAGTTPFTIEMEQWDLNCTSWRLDNTGFHLKQGNLNASGVVFGYNEIKIEQGELVFGTSTTLGKSDVTLIDLLTLEIENDPDLIYNGSNWQIYVGGSIENPAASIGNVPGLPVINNDLTLQILLFYSNSDAEFKMNNNTFDLYKVTTFTTDEGALYVHKDDVSGESYLTLPGIIDLNLPSISVQPTAFLIKNNNGVIETGLESFGFGMEVNGVIADFNAGDIEFKTNGLIVNGTVSENPYFSHDVKLYHLTDSTAINTIANQKFQYTNNGQSINNLFGRMYPLTNSWTNYQFTGDVVGANKTSGKWTFTVYGEITAENQKVDVDDLKMTGGGQANMDFDNMGMSYDFANRRLVGSLSIDESMPGDGSISGQANIVFDDAGWYFVCGGMVSMPSNPYVTEVSLALLFGDYPIGSEQPVKDIFKEYSYNGGLPDAFANDISGFYFDGKIEMPIPYVPNFEVDFVVVSAEFEAGITAGFQLGMNFTDALNTYYTGLAADIHVHAGVGASVVFGCAGVALDAQVGLGLAGQYSSNGEWFIIGTFEASLSASAYAGVGLACDSECDGLCEMDEWSGAVGVKLKGEMGYQNGENYSDVGIEEAYIK